MERINLDFAIDFQERTNTMDFKVAVKETIRQYLSKIDRSKSTDDTIAFIDKSGCKFEGHNITLIEVD